MKKIDGKKVAEEILKDVASEIKFKNVEPGLAVILVGNDQASKVYVEIKKKRAKEVGINFSLFNFDESVDEDEVLQKIREMNDDEKINGIIVQLPLPKKFNTQKIIDSINPLKDVDGFSYDIENKKNILQPVFPTAIIKLLESSKQEIENKKAVVISNSKIFGEMMARMLQGKKIKSEYVLKKEISDNLKKIKETDILISAVGEKGIVRGEMIKDGVIIIDGGISKENNKVFGDVDFESTEKFSGFITPVPGGVGPVTVACLLKNVLIASGI
jgi:methylenetetrahydrofolate dehydrogenase (NADP+) / methenyltetrahydrofolate cyclohydrolase